MQASAPLILFDDVLMSKEISGRLTGLIQVARSQISSWTSGPDRALDLRWPTLRVTCLAITSSHLRKNNSPPTIVKKCIISVYWCQHKARSLKPVFDSASLADWKCNATASLLLLLGHSTRAGPCSILRAGPHGLLDEYSMYEVLVSSSTEYLSWSYPQFGGLHWPNALNRQPLLDPTAGNG